MPFSVLLKCRPEHFGNLQDTVGEYEVIDIDGELQWSYVLGTGRVGSEEDLKVALPLLGAGFMTGTPVTPEESESITGLYYPASMDRLRELVEESRVLFTGGE